VQRALLIVLVAASYLLLAGAYNWALGPLLAIAALAVVAAPRRTLSSNRMWRVIDGALIAVCGALLIQLLPLPAALVNAVSPGAGRVRSALQFAPLNATASGWTTLSIDTDATLAALATVVLGVLSFWISRSVFGSGGNTRHVCRALAIIGAAAAIMAVVQRAVTPRLVLFVSSPEARSAFPFGAFINRNHMAGWLLLIAAPVGGYLIARLRTHPASREREWRFALKRLLSSGATVTGLTLVIIVGVLLLTLSRSAVIGLGAAAVVLWLLGRSRLQLDRTQAPALLAAAGAILVVTMFFIDLDGWATRLQESFDTGPADYNRIRIWQETLPIVRDFWLTGTGAGTYSDAMTQYQQSRIWVGSMQRWAHFNNAHSHYVQLVSEGGLLLVIPVLVGLVAFVRVAVRAARTDKGEMFWVRAGAVAGLAGLAVQSIWEVSLTMPAIVVLTGLLAGLAVYQREAAYGDSIDTPDALHRRRRY